MRANLFRLSERLVPLHSFAKSPPSFVCVFFSSFSCALVLSVSNVQGCAFLFFWMSLCFFLCVTMNVGTDFEGPADTKTAGFASDLFDRNRRRGRARRVPLRLRRPKMPAASSTWRSLLFFVGWCHTVRTGLQIAPTPWSPVCVNEIVAEDKTVHSHRQHVDTRFFLNCLREPSPTCVSAIRTSCSFYLRNPQVATHKMAADVRKRNSVAKCFFFACAALERVFLGFFLTHPLPSALTWFH